VSVVISECSHGVLLLLVDFTSSSREYSLVNTPRPTPFLAAEHDLLRDRNIIDRSAVHLRSNSFVRSIIDIKVTINQRLRTKLHPSIVAIDHEHQVVIARLVKAVQILGRTIDFSQMRAAFDKSWIIECLVPIDDSRSWIAKDVARCYCFAEIWIWS
jgi:hypothetical protein